ncbi:aldehyde dehydrogenase family protein [Albidovulum sp.]|uniref:aldehyde dehydrogenase family protein n=1 Tax=Albidovulum sp. TaxID=1872424 RepID=UPI0039B9CD4D
MDHFAKLYIDGQWVDPVVPATLDVISPATETACATIALGSAKDVDLAVAAARRAFPVWSQSPVETRLEILTRILTIFQRRKLEIAPWISAEMGCPITLSIEAQVEMCVGHIEAAIAGLRDFKFRETIGRSLILKEPIGVAGLITPWNWPLNQIFLKVMPGIAMGCTMVLKPSEMTPLDAVFFTEILDEAGVPAGVFNLVQGTGPEVGAAISSHPGIDFVSFTGSTRAGVLIAKAAADTVKRVAQELGGKSANILLDDADFPKAVRQGVQVCMANSGQSCDAPTRMLVPHHRMDEAVEIAVATVAPLKIGNPADPKTDLGPVANAVQFAKIRRLIQKGIDEGATLATGGPDMPQGLNQGFYIRPTIFSHVTNDMAVAQEEIFGPVLCILGYGSEDEAVQIANDTPYGLAAYVQSKDQDHALAVAARVQVGSVFVNGPNLDHAAPFGGYKQSGNGREGGVLGMAEFLEVKAITCGEA